ncbi:hypothetical protein HK100_001774 [Physocladia obscura]|uniref:DUF3844 domain-containing protein n=1 Tax=Physocladia obscura TaxID=109957 RepID=A0AAD5SYV5_9FUNG|nr:hypothetical protein HK100_001774 [Physocladia obscura]
MAVVATVASPVSIHLRQQPTTTTTTIANISWSDVTSILALSNAVTRSFRLPEPPVLVSADSLPDHQLVVSSSGAALDLSIPFQQDIFSKPSASLVLLLAGLDEDRVPLEISYSVKTPASVIAASEYLMHFAELVSSDSPARANLVSISSDETNTKAIAGISRFILKKDNVFSLIPDVTTAAFKTLSKNVAKTSYKNIQGQFSSKFSYIPKIDSLNQNVQVDRLFMIEMNFVAGFFDLLKDRSSEMLSPSVEGYYSDYFSVSMTRLNKIYEVYGKESVQYKVASEVFATVISQLLKNFEAIYHDGIVQIISLAPEAGSQLKKRDDFQVSLDKRLAVVNTVCPQHFSDCMTCYTNNTDDNGELIIGGAHRKVLWSGPACAKQDISADFHLLLWTTVGLVVALVFIIGLLSSVGNDEGAAHGAGAGKKKED